MAVNSLHKNHLNEVFRYKDAHLTRSDLQQIGYTNANILSDDDMRNIIKNATERAYHETEMHSHDILLICPKHYEIWWKHIITECNKHPKLSK